MLKKSENMQSKMILFTLDELVPENSLYRKIDKYIDFSFIYDKVNREIVDSIWIEPNKPDVVRR